VLIGVVGPQGVGVYEKDLNAGGDAQLLFRMDPQDVYSYFSDFRETGSM
jgi:hypothetical protein